MVKGVTYTAVRLLCAVMVAALLAGCSAAKVVPDGRYMLDGVELEITEDAVREIAKKSYERKTGARGLRAIMENVMMDIMYQAPSDETLKACRITEDTVKSGGAPLLEHDETVRSESA